ncbi:hypothetical protein CC86DRAFT_401466 [Ophiobolus disseminans]|uniref:Uncharacterized protein n=1 Tax=Ophiobolus disseminans TaxID=1469910 RepID=A0A6A7AHE1_9PLEO|nr:hypothetical protein CC86DRAFT_401466 [Ophiobolus disseminans]
MATAVAGAPPPPPVGPPPDPSGGPPAARFCIRHLSRQLSDLDVAAGHTRCPECQDKLRTETATMRKKRKIGGRGLSIDVTAGATVEPGLASSTPLEKRRTARTPLTRLFAPLTLPPAMQSSQPRLGLPPRLYVPIAPVLSASNVHYPAVAAPPTIAFGLATGRPSLTLGFLPRGQYSPDTPTTAAARRDRDAIRRDHRVRDRAGEEVSSTPELRQLR